MRVERKLDTYLHDFTAAQIEACEATYVRGVQSPAILDLRMRCLDRRLYEVSALVEQLRSASESTLELLSGAGQDLTPISSCADVAALSAPVPLPDTAQGRQAVTKLQRTLAALHTAERIGLFSKVLPAAHAAVKEAKDTGYPPALAEAQMLLAELQIQSGERTVAEQALFQAVAAAVSGRDHHLAARAWTLLMFLASNRKDFDAAQRWEWMARAELDLTSAADDIKGQLFNNLCVLGLRKRTYAEALPSCQQAIFYRKRYFGENHPQVAAVLANQSVIYRAMGQLDKSLELALAAYQMDVEVLGPVHPKLGADLTTVASTYRAKQDYSKADQAYGKTIEIYKTSFGSEHPRVTEVMVSLARSKMEQQKLPEALKLAEQIHASRVKLLGSQAAEVASAKQLMGRIYRLELRFKEALPLYRDSLLIYEAKRNNEGVSLALLGMASCLSELGQAKQALLLLDRAERLRAETSPADREADLQFARARALWARAKANRAQVLQLTQSARAAYVKLGPSSHADVALLDAWLTDKKLR